MFYSDASYQDEQFDKAGERETKSFGFLEFPPLSIAITKSIDFKSLKSWV